MENIPENMSARAMDLRAIDPKQRLSPENISFPAEDAGNRLREAVGVFLDADDLQHAVSALEAVGFERRRISVLGSEAALRENFGTADVPAQTLEDHPNAPRSPDIKKEELGVGQGVLVGGGMFLGIVAAALASGGIAVSGTAAPLAIVLGGAGGAGIGAGLAKMLGDKYAAFFNRQIERGGLLLWVATNGAADELRAKEILIEYGATDVHIHEFERDETGKTVRCVTDDNFSPCDKIERLIVKHSAILREDKTLEIKMRQVYETLKDAPAAAAERRIEDAILYARDMAEEEQRIVAECDEGACGNEEKEAEQYFSLVRDLKDYNADFRRQKMAA